MTQSDIDEKKRKELLEKFPKEKIKKVPSPPDPKTSGKTRFHFRDTKPQLGEEVIYRK